MLCNWLGYASAHQQVGLFQEKRGLGEDRRYQTILWNWSLSSEDDFSPYQHVDLVDQLDDLGLGLVRLYNTKDER